MSMLRPGVPCNEVYENVRTRYENHGYKVPHYCGHQIGTGVNEGPRFVPYDNSVIEKGMVFCLEIGLYEGKGGTTGVRCEKMLLINDDGCEPLNNFAWGMEQ